MLVYAGVICNLIFQLLLIHMIHNIYIYAVYIYHIISIIYIYIL